MSTSVSLWAIAAASQLAGAKDAPLYSYVKKGLTFEVFALNDSLWVVSKPHKKANLAFRTASIRQMGLSMLKPLLIVKPK